MNDYPLVWIIIGVSGSGKTTIGRLLAERLDCDFLEGDRRHSPQNIEKMRSNESLGDEDRHSWLLKIENDIRRAIEQNQETVITCSALKESYRKQLTSIGRLGQVQLIWIKVSESELKRRLSQRQHPYMTIHLLQSQLKTFEELTPDETKEIITVGGLLPKNEIINEIIANAVEKFPDFQQHWQQIISEEMWWESYRMNSKDIFEMARKEIHYEHNLIANRMTWYVTSQSFLMAAFTISRNSTNKHPWLVILIPILGIVTSIITESSLLAAIAAMEHWREYLREIVKVDENLKQLQGLFGVSTKSSQKDRLKWDKAPWIHPVGLLTPKLTPVIFFSAWISILILWQVFH